MPKLIKVYSLFGTCIVSCGMEKKNPIAVQKQFFDNRQIKSPTLMV